MKFFLALFLSLFLAASPAFADTFVPSYPTTNTGYGTTIDTLGGVTGSCAAFRQIYPLVDLMTVDCAGNVGANSFNAPTFTATGLTPGGCVQAGTGGTLTTPTSTACGAGGGSTSARYLINPVNAISFGSTNTFVLAPGLPASVVGSATVKTLDVACSPYSSGTGVQNTYNSATITGGTLVVYDIATGATSATNLATIVVANTTTGTGNETLVTLGTPYSMPANSALFAQVTVRNGTSNYWAGCQVFAGT